MIDLHVHSTASDGSRTPADLVRLAQAAGLEAMALTDHDTTDGLPEFRAAAAAAGVQAVPGIEFSCSWYEGTMHMLGLWIEPGHPALQALITKTRESRLRRNEAILQKLKFLGVPVRPEDVEAAGMAGAVLGRPHIARALVQAGHCQDLPDAFMRFLAHGRPAYIRRFLPLPEEVITTIHEAGGAAVWAHPTAQLRSSPAKLRQTARVLMKSGLDGMEAFYVEFTDAESALAQATARQLGLLASGGSDYHGENSPGVELGRGRGSLAVPSALLEPLLERVRNIRRHYGLPLP